MKPSNFFTETEKNNILEAIRAAEKNTSGEIRVHIEKDCKSNVLDRAAYLFEKLGMHKTEKRNGVLFYLAVEDHKFAILGDAGINKETPANFWDEVRDTVLSRFKEGDYAGGLVAGIKMAGKKLQAYFPYQQDDVNELPDDISFNDQEEK
ncbi:MAG: TPM domain-containing protein [Chlorobi bacterium]|nr:TPM domain-containing protein [Chlorobiota bacterium]